MIAEITLSSSEFESQNLSPSSFSKALGYLETEGYLVLHNVIATSHLDALKDDFDAAWLRFKSAKPTWLAGGRIIGHLNVAPPVSEHLANSSVLANKIICALSSAVLGPGLRITGIGGNTNAPGSVDQYFHSDVDDKDFDKLLVNIPLGDANEQNGSIELVPRSHKADIHFPEPRDMQMAAKPVRINTQKGSVLMRYPHVWHRGRANLSGKPRHMLAAWHESVSQTEHTEKRFLLDPTDRDLFAAHAGLAHSLGSYRTAPEFHPNYFSTGIAGLIKETTYRFAPASYLYLHRQLKRLKPIKRVVR